MKKYIFIVLMLMMGLLAAPAIAEYAEGCFGQDSTGRGEVPNPCVTAKCYRELNGRGEVITWAKTKRQCENQTVGRSWGYPGNATNIYRDFFTN